MKENVEKPRNRRNPVESILLFKTYYYHLSMAFSRVYDVGNVCLPVKEHREQMRKIGTNLRSIFPALTKIRWLNLLGLIFEVEQVRLNNHQ